MANEKRLIDANKVLERADEVTFMGFRAEERKKHFMDLVSEILKQPTVDAVEVVHGRWSPVTYGLGVTVTRWMCSNCKKYENSYGRTNYCPNCGAKMDGITDKC